MSKAFTKESDDFQDDPEPSSVRPQLPPGSKNYITPDGAQRMRDDLARLNEQRLALRHDSEDAEANRVGLRGLDRQIRALTESLESATVVEHDERNSGRVRFGAFVSVRDSAGVESCYRIVGIDEADIDKGYLSWMSPLAKALLNSEVGQRVRFRFPAGEEQLEVTRIEYR